VTTAYPRAPAERDHWILDRRGARNAVDAGRAYAELTEEEPAGSGETVSISTIFLTNRECPWRCLMCDLWRNTLPDSVPAGAIPAQIRDSLARLPPARWVKLYNAGSFFDPKAIPRDDYAAIARLLSGAERVIVESHPALCADATLELRDLLAAELEVGLGLETIHPGVLPRLNKRMTLDTFRRAAAFLREAGISVRVFVLVGLPFVSHREALDWALRSVEFAFDCGAEVVSLIPTRTGNGALDALEERGEFSPPDLAMLEEAIEAGLALGGGLGRGRVLADLWDLERFSRCGRCFPHRAERLRTMNLAQAAAPPVSCDVCGGSRVRA
jgi:radical SAM enzyme (TIGR01210 family)